MSAIGPQLPPHLTKRKRTPDLEEEDGNASSSSNKHPRRDAPGATKNTNEIDLGDSDSDSDSDDVGPRAPPSIAARVSGPLRPVVGPALPASNTDEIDLDSDDEDVGPRAPPSLARISGPSRPIAGPTLPPSIEHEPTSTTKPQAPSRPISGPAPPAAAAVADLETDSSSDSEDDFGPSLPSTSNPRAHPIGPTLPSLEDTSTAPKRDEWMLAPPPSSSTFSERDTTRLKARKFASKPAAKAPAQGAPSIWTETPEEKLRRLQDSVLGRTAPDDGSGARLDPLAEERRRAREERDRGIAASIEAQRGRSLYEEHQNRKDGDRSSGKHKKGGDKKEGEEEEEEEDDPSKRAFDREKDMALGGKINTSQRRELINKSANFGGGLQRVHFYSRLYTYSSELRGVQETRNGQDFKKIMAHRVYKLDSMEKHDLDFTTRQIVCLTSIFALITLSC
ncbi:hypothetical protein PT974_06209 [Cladobotryum mycophilum]|uniref:DUF3752 domain-containing protein n=1 Tax=Cladobotryum mycophilum TaxID=491253 RepID=A0ABR0SKY8_9HYPO